jgi:single-strand DNA-binding protein
MDKENHKNFTTEIVAAQVTFLGGRDGASAGRGAGGPTDDFGPPPPELSNGDTGGGGMGPGGGGGPAQVDDIPF